MDAARTSSLPSRVVLLSADAVLTSRLRRQLARRLTVRAVPTAYEAAAEVLADPPASLMIDPRAAGDDLAGLLAVARDAGVPVASCDREPGVEGLPAANAGDLPLRGQTRTARRARPEPQARPGVDEPPPPPEPPSEPETEPEDAVPVEAERQYEPELSEDVAGGKAGIAEPAPPPPADDTDPEDAGAPEPEAPSDLLTPEELAALLENEA